MQVCSVLHVAHVGVRRVTVVIVHIGRDEVLVVIYFCVTILVVIFCIRRCSLYTTTWTPWKITCATPPRGASTPTTSPTPSQVWVGWVMVWVGWIVVGWVVVGWLWVGWVWLGLVGFGWVWLGLVGFGWCEGVRVVIGDETPFGGVAQVILHGVQVVEVGLQVREHQDRGEEEVGEGQVEVEREVEENQRQQHMCMVWRWNDRLKELEPMWCDT